MKIGNEVFGGERPKIANANLKNNESRLAIDCRLTSTALEPLNTNLPIETLDFDVKTIYFMDDEWLSWDKRVNVAESPIGAETNRRLFWTGDGFPMQATLQDKLAGRSYRMGVPTPKAPQVFSITGDPDEVGSSVITTFYACTFVNRWGEEGDLSDPSSLVDYKTGQVLTVNNIGIVGGNYQNLQTYDSVVSMRLYRYGENDTRFIAELPIATLEYEDATGTLILGNPYTTKDYIPPPEDMEGLHVMANGIGIGFVGKTVHLSVSGNLNAWPYSFPTKSNIVAISSFDNTVVVLTKGSPEVATVYDPSSVSPSVVAEYRPCISAWAVVQVSGGVIYPTSSGLFFIGPSGSQLITRDYIDEYWWRNYVDADSHACVRDNEYYFWANGKCLVFDMGESNGTLRRLSRYYDAAHTVDGTDDMYLIADKRRIEKFQAGNGRLTYTWRSKEFLTGNPVAMISARVNSPDLSYVQTIDLSVSREDQIAANAQAISDRMALGMAFGIGGAINQDIIGGSVGITVGQTNLMSGASIGNGCDIALPDSQNADFLDVNVIANSQVIDSTRVQGESEYRLTYSDRARYWSYELQGNITVDRFSMAGSSSELHHGS